MRELFGLPIATLGVVLLIALAACFGAVGALAIRNRVFVKLGLRNIERRRGRTVIIVTGLMLATAIIASALGTGDTMASTTRSSVVMSYGQIDELVGVRSATNTASVAGLGLSGQQTEVSYFPQARFPEVAAAARRTGQVDAVAPAIMAPVAVQDQTSRQNEPRVTLFATDPAHAHGLGTIHRVGGGEVSLASLRSGEVFVNDHAAGELGASTGDHIVIYTGTGLRPLTIAGVVGYQGAGTDGSAVLLPLNAAQRLLGRVGQIQYVLVSNRGGVTSGASRSDAVRHALGPAVAQLQLQVQPVKADGLDVADKQGASFMSLFTTFGTFTIAAGILLIFLIFVMLAAERRSEMGVARAVGTQRSHLVEMFMFEGVAYDVVAAAVGALVGVAIAYGMVTVLAGALATYGVHVRHSVSLRSVLIAYALGVLLTFVVVVASAWRVSVLDVATAIRDLPAPPKQGRRRSRWGWAAAVVAFGGVLTVAGRSGAQGSSFLLGVSLVVVGLVLVAVAARVPTRVAYTAGGVALVVWWLLPFWLYRQMVPGMKMNFSVWVIAGLVVVVGATWTIVNNADVVMSGVLRAAGRVRAFVPIVKVSVAGPLRSRFRTGVTLAMFTLVVFTLVVGTTTSNAFTQASSDQNTFGGGFQVQALTAPLGSSFDMATAARHAPGVRAADIQAVAGVSTVPAKIRQLGLGPTTLEDYALRGLDDTFLDRTTYGFASRAKGYTSDRQVWQALQRDPTLAVVDAFVVPHRSNFGFGVMPKLRLRGLAVEDRTFNAVHLMVRDPQTGKDQRLTVIGVLKDTTPYTMAGVLTSQRTLRPFGSRAQPTTYDFALRPAADATAVAKHLESAFLNRGMQAKSVSKLVDEAMGTSLTFQRLILGFLGLGLVIGVAALGVISARSVVERRQQIGVLRAIGYRRRMVAAIFLVESSFITLVSIVVGTALGLAIAYNVIADSASQPSWNNLRFSVPWPMIALVFVFVYAAALLTTWLPARRASKVEPADALRFQ